MTQAQLDLRELALERPDVRTPVRTRRRPWITRYVVPGVVLAGFSALLVIAAGEQFLPRAAVTVVPVVVTRAEVQREGTPLFQAAGWIEPRPTSVNVAALTEGVVETLLVVEGQQVEVHEPVAKLIDTDAGLAVRQVEAIRSLQEAELQSAQAELKAARLRVENPVHLEAALADSESLLARTKTALAGIPFLIKSAEARLEYAQQNVAGKESAGTAIAGRLIQQARSEHASVQAELDELKQRTPRLERESQALQRKVEALTNQLTLLIEESRQLEEAEARCKAAQARLQTAELAVEKAALAFDRTIVRAPLSGRVLKLIAHPGTRVMGLESTAGQSSSSVVTLYDPLMLQVRADVRLEDVPLVQPGQLVRIETASSKEPMTGTVLMSTSAANIQKNTLEVKIAIDDPPAAVRPEMLVTATFLAAPPATSQDEDSRDFERLLIPRQLVELNDGGATVWIVDAEGLARKQPIKLGKAGTAALVEVIDGIRLTDKLISTGQQGLQPGSRVTVAGEDSAVGLDDRPSAISAGGK